MLAASIKFICKNEADQTVDMTVSVSPWKFNASGALEYRTPASDYTASPVAGASATSSAHDNTSNLDLGAHLDITIQPQATTDGTVTVYMVFGTGDQETIALVSTSYATANDLRIFNAEL